MTYRDGSTVGCKWVNGKVDGFAVRRSSSGEVLASGYYRAGQRVVKSKPKVRRQVASRSKKSRRHSGGTITCHQCNGLGLIYTEAVTETRPPTTPIMPGHKLYGSRYTHIEHEATIRNRGTTVVVKPAGSRICGYCKGKGRVVK